MSQVVEKRRGSLPSPGVKGESTVRHRPTPSYGLLRSLEARYEWGVEAPGN